MKEVQEVETGPVIKVIGLGGGGGNAVEYMVRSDVRGVDFICANTDIQALSNLTVDTCIKLGSDGLGAGADPVKGMEAAKQDIEEVKQSIKGADMLFITAGMGGGTGTGSAPVVAQAAREMGILTVGIVSKPFKFERRNKLAEAGIKELSECVDSLITVPNEKLLKVLGRDFVLAKAFDYANEVLHGAVQGISELVTKPGLINVDFEDLRTVMSEHGVAMMGVGYATGEDRAIKAVEKALANPLLEDIAVSGARGLLVNITSGLDFTLGEFNDVGDVIDTVASEDAKVIVGTSIDDSMSDEVRVTVVATGISSAAESVKNKDLSTPSLNLRGVEAIKTEEKAIAEEETANTFELVQPKSATKKEEIKEEIKEVVRPEMVMNGGVSSSVDGGSNYLDIPAFLRRQAD